MIPVAKIDNLLRLDIQNGNFFVTLHINLIQILMQMPDLSTYFPVTDPHVDILFSVEHHSVCTYFIG